MLKACAFFILFEFYLLFPFFPLDVLLYASREKERKIPFKSCLVRRHVIFDVTENKKEMGKKLVSFCFFIDLFLMLKAYAFFLSHWFLFSIAVSPLTIFIYRYPSSADDFRLNLPEPSLRKKHSEKSECFLILYLGAANHNLPTRSIITLNSPEAIILGDLLCGRFANLVLFSCYYLQSPYTVPIIVRVVTPGVVVITPVVGSCV